MFFEFAIEFYPSSANAYDSMSEYYERVDDYDNALKFATKAYQINHNDYYKQRIEALKKNVTQHMYGGDITRKMKLRDKQKKGKKKMQALGKVNINHEVFLKMMKSD